jgi:hypothetical protein
MVACWNSIQFLEFSRAAFKIWNHGDVTAQPLTEDRPARLLLAGSSRRSGCVPAEPYPPLEQRVDFPFPFS